ESEAPGLQRAPYPPALYAILGAIVSPAQDGTSHDERSVRLMLGLLEGTAPFLILAIMRAAGLSGVAAGASAAAMAVMPEGLLVLAKGIGANIFGAYVGLLLILALLRQAAARSSNTGAER
ncbi:MAG: hypothetical protein MUF51_04410, partial [Vicinamibacteria bacterium]|nr:hypothetical protein [Vicinamibacteria bacterium]